MEDRIDNQARKKKIIIISLVIIVLALIGITYAFLRLRLEGEKVITIRVKGLDVELDESGSDGINIENAIPVSDEEGKSNQAYKFSIINNDKKKITYGLYLDNDEEQKSDCDTEKGSSCGLLNHDVISYQLKKNGSVIGEGTLSSLEDNLLHNSEGIESKGTDKYELVIWLNKTAENDSIDKYYFGRIRVDAVEYKEPPKAIDALLANYTNDEDVQDYDLGYTKTDVNAKENKMYVFNHASSKGSQQSDWSEDELKSYRYIGANPNNYVTFNNEKAGWRIIGIETVDDGTGKREKRIKLIRKDLLPVGTDNYLSWDNKPSGTGSSESEYGSNDWYDSRLMYLLNPNHEGETTGVSGSIYWNRQSGNCPKGQNNATTTCDFSEVGLLPETQKLIGDAKWYLGGTENYDSAETGTPNHFYGYERGEETCTTTGSCTKERKTNWTGKIGLMYPSDYGYATSGGTSKTRDTCLSDTVYNYDAEDCKNNDWLFINGTYQWTIAPYSGYSSNVFIVDTGGFVRRYNVAGSDTVARPVVYLTSNIQLLKGTGAVDDPFEFGL